MPSSRPRVYVDACVFVSVLMAEDTSAMGLAVLNAAKRRHITIIASRSLPIEIGACRGNRPGEKVADDLIERYLDSVSAEWVEVDLTIAREARRLSWTNKLRPGDTVHLATAIRRRADYFMTFDDKDSPVGTSIDGVKIETPKIIWEPTLEDG